MQKSWQASGCFSISLTKGIEPHTNRPHTKPTECQASGRQVPHPACGRASGSGAPTRKRHQVASRWRNEEGRVVRGERIALGGRYRWLAMFGINMQSKNILTIIFIHDTYENIWRSFLGDICDWKGIFQRSPLDNLLCKFFIKSVWIKMNRRTTCQSKQLSD